MGINWQRRTGLLPLISLNAINISVYKELKRMCSISFTQHSIIPQLFVQYRIKSHSYYSFKLTSSPDLINYTPSKNETIHYTHPRKTAQMPLTICKTPIHNSICRISFAIFFVACPKGAKVALEKQTAPLRQRRRSII